MNDAKEIQLASEKEQSILERYWSRIHVKNDYLRTHLLKENVLLKRQYQLFLLAQSYLSVMERHAKVLLDKIAHLKIIQLGIFLGWLQNDNFQPSLGFLHVIDADNCRAIILPSRLIGAFTRGKTLYVTPAMKIKHLDWHLREELIFVVKSNDFILGLGTLDVVSESDNKRILLRPIVHVGEYLSAEGEHFI